MRALKTEHNLCWIPISKAQKDKRFKGSFYLTIYKGEAFFRQTTSWRTWRQCNGRCLPHSTPSMRLLSHMRRACPCSRHRYLLEDMQIPATINHKNPNELKIEQSTITSAKKTSKNKNKKFEQDHKTERRAFPFICRRKKINISQEACSKDDDMETREVLFTCSIIFFMSLPKLTFLNLWCRLSFLHFFLEKKKKQYSFLKISHGKCG